LKQLQRAVSRKKKGSYRRRKAVAILARLHERVANQRKTEGTGEIVRSLMAEAQFNPDFAKVFRETFIFSRRQALIRILERCVQRGELPRNADVELIADLCYGPIWYRLMNRHATLEEPFVSSLVTYLF
jgi:hypothetical protein